MPFRRQTAAPRERTGPHSLPRGHKAYPVAALNSPPSPGHGPWLSPAGRIGSFARLSPWPQAAANPRRITLMSSNATGPGATAQQTPRAVDCVPATRAAGARRVLARSSGPAHPAPRTRPRRRSPGGCRTTCAGPGNDPDSLSAQTLPTRPAPRRSLRECSCRRADARASGCGSRGCRSAPRYPATPRPRRATASVRWRYELGN